MTRVVCIGMLYSMYFYPINLPSLYVLSFCCFLGCHFMHAGRSMLNLKCVFSNFVQLCIVIVCGRYASSEPAEWQAVPEVGVHIPHDPTVNLASTGLSGDIFHQPGSPCVRGQRGSAYPLRFTFSLYMRHDILSNQMGLCKTEFKGWVK